MANPNPNTKGLKPPFSSTNQPKKKGRKPSVLKKFIKDNNLTADDIARAAKFLLPKTKKELSSLKNDPSVPIVITLFVEGLLKDLENGYLNNILKMFDRAFGKPKEFKETKIIDNDQLKLLDNSELTEDDAKKLFFEALKKMNK